MKPKKFTRADVKILEKIPLYQGFLKVFRYQLQHTLFQGGVSQILSREVCHQPPAVGVLPYDPIRDEVVLIQQFRAGALNSDSSWLLEIVAGLDDKCDGHADNVARREMLEETALDPLDLRLIAEYWSSPGASDEKISLFLGIVDASHASGIHGNNEEGEDIAVYTFKAEEAFAMLRNNQINDSVTLIALQWLYIHHQEIKHT